VTNKAEEHQRLILEQFTKQAIPFRRCSHSHELLLTASGAGPADTALDVACGPGLMACAFAKVARHVTGIDRRHVKSHDRVAHLGSERNIFSRGTVRYSSSPLWE
jgi:predicted TPR repeat methyltransferase